jgi:hypothetical protein
MGPGPKLQKRAPLLKASPTCSFNGEDRVLKRPIGGLLVPVHNWKQAWRGCHNATRFKCWLTSWHGEITPFHMAWRLEQVGFHPRPDTTAAVPRKRRGSSPTSAASFSTLEQIKTGQRQANHSAKTAKSSKSVMAQSAAVSKVSSTPDLQDADHQASV